MNSDIILKAEDLHFSYDDDHSHSLNGLSLEIRRGQKVAFMEQTAAENLPFSLLYRNPQTSVRKAVF